MKEILGTKLGCTRIFMDDGSAVPVTVVEAGPCPVVQVKTEETDGYAAYQVAFGKERPLRKSGAGSKRTRQANKPMAGHYTKSGVAPRQYLRELRIDDVELNPGDEVKADIFAVGDRVDVTGTSRGLGFAGGMKRHHFQGANKTHGQSDRWRAPGSIGQSSYPSRVLKGLRMAGRMGNETVTVINTEIVKVIGDENLILIKGNVPGKRGSLVKIKTSTRNR